MEISGSVFSVVNAAKLADVTSPNWQMAPDLLGNESVDRGCS